MGNYSESQLTIYLKKQRSFINLVNNIQNAINSKDYKKQGYSFGSYVRKNWNISKAQAYRYIISAKILDYLKEFEILPNYERLCRTISSIAKTPDQVRILWKFVLRKVENRLDEITSSFIMKIWEELCQNEKYNNIFHLEDDVMKRIDNSLNKLSKIKINRKNEPVSKRINNKSPKSSIPSPSYTEDNTKINDNISQNSSVDSSSISIIKNNIINSNLNNSSQLTNSQQLNITSQALDNYPINNNYNNYNNYNSQINSIPYSFSYDSLNTNYNSNSSLNEQNNNSQILYYSVPVTNVNSSNYNYYSMVNTQTYSQTVPVTSSNTIYYMVNTPNQQSILISNELPVQFIY